jgi:tetratricopeptide (TPR) repeat protein
VPGGGGRLRFSHVLIRDALYEDLPVPRRVALHRRIGAALEDAYGHNPEPHFAELAHHYAEAGAAYRDKAIHYAWRAGDQAASQLAYEEAARHYRSALALADAQAADPSRSAELLLSLGDVLSRAGDGTAAKDAFGRAAATAERAGDSERLARAALGYGGRFVWARDRELVPLLERALAAVGPADSPARVRLLTSLASAIREDPSRERRVALADEGITMARRLGDPATLAHALAGQWPAVSSAHNLRTRMGTADELVALADAMGDRERAYLAHEYRLNTYWGLGDRAGMDVELEALESIAEELRQPPQRWHLTCVQAAVALMEGRLETAEELIDESVELGERAQSWNAEVSRRNQLFILRRAQGRLDELVDVLARSVREYPSLIRFACALAHTHAELGHEHEARDGLHELLTRDLAARHLDEEWLLALSLLPATCAFLGDMDAAERLYDILLPFEDLYVQAPIEAVFGAVARGLGELAATAGRVDDAERHFQAAIETESRMRARPWLAHAQHDLAELLAARGDRERAQGLAHEALASYRELGMQSWAERVAPLS